jgi:hypothetical protein
MQKKREIQSNDEHVPQRYNYDLRESAEEYYDNLQKNK